MKTEKIDKNGLKRVFRALSDDKKIESVIGSYLYNGHRIQISKFGQSTAQRVSQLYKRRRINSQCILCGQKVQRINKRTGKVYRLCDTHRKAIDLKVRK